MSKNRQRSSSGSPGKSPIDVLIAKYGLAGILITSLLSVLGVGLTAYFGYLGIRIQIEGPIKATQAAETRNTQVALATISLLANTPLYQQKTLTPQITPTLNIQSGDEVIIFHSLQKDGTYEIYLMENGGEPIALTSNTSKDMFPSVSVEGKIVFGSDRTDNSEIYTINMRGTDESRLTATTAQNWYPVWSPDGRQIAFVSDRDGDNEIYVMQADGTQQTRLTSNKADDADPAWSPDGRQIAFSSTRDGDDDIYVMQADGTNVVRLTDAKGYDNHPSWSPEGSKIVFASFRDGNWEIYVMKYDGTGLARLTSNSFDDRDPSWSPDGNQIAFSTNRSGDYEIYTMRPDGTNPHRLTVNDTSDFGPNWSYIFLLRPTPVFITRTPEPPPATWTVEPPPAPP